MHLKEQRSVKMQRRNFWMHIRYVSYANMKDGIEKQPKFG